MEEHRNHVRLVLERLRQHHLKVSSEKCVIATNCIEYLDHQIDGKVTMPLNKHLQAIKDFPTPKNKKHIQKFLGICNWVREYVKDMAQLTYPITKLLHKNQRFVWTIECQEAFDKIKQLMSQPLKLHRPDFARRFYLQVDASTLGLGAVLFQKNEEDNRQIISYASTTLNKTEKKYHVNELEVYGALFGIRKYRAYLADKTFTLITDSRSLYWLEKNRDSKAKLTRWSLLLQEYDFEVEHCKGKENELADFLSRSATQNDGRSFLDEERLLPPETHKIGFAQPINVLSQPQLYEYVKNQQAENQAVRNNILVWLDIDRTEPDTPREAAFHANHVVQENILYYRKGDRKLLIIPLQALYTVISHHHDTEEAAHPGIKETVRTIQQLYHSNNLVRKVSEYVNNCLVCHSVKGRQLQQKGPQRPHVASSPFEILSIDVLGPYPKTQKGNRFILIVEDLFTKWVEAKAVENAEVENVCTFLEEEIFNRFRYPRAIISDNGVVFRSNRYTRMCTRNNITPYYTAIYYHRQNPVERKVQTFKATMTTLLLRERNQRNKWDHYIGRALRAYRTRRNRATGETPAMALLGYEIALPGQWEIPEFQQRRRTEREERAVRRQHIVARQLNFNQHTYPNQDEQPEITFQRGDQVMVRNYAINQPFKTAWVGPFPVTRVLSDQMYLVDRNGKESRYHVDQLRPAPAGNEPESDEEDHPIERTPPQISDEENDENNSGTREDAHRPAETDVDPGPSTSGQPVQRLNVVSEYKHKRVRETRGERRQRGSRHHQGSMRHREPHRHHLQPRSNSTARDVNTIARICDASARNQRDATARVR